MSFTVKVGNKTQHDRGEVLKLLSGGAVGSVHHTYPSSTSSLDSQEAGGSWLGPVFEVIFNHFLFWGSFFVAAPSWG